MSAILVLVAAGAIVLVIKWPFTKAQIRAELSSATSADVQLRSFRTKYFPPGCVIEGLQLRQRGSSNPPLLTAARLTVRANYRGLFHKRIELLRLEDVNVDMAQRAAPSNGNGEAGNHAPSQPSRGQSTRRAHSDSVTIARIVLDGGVIVFRRNGQPLPFRVHQLTLGSFDHDKPVSFHATLENPLPPGHVAVDGQLGPWNPSDPAATPLSGSYRFTDASLGALGGIAGTLASQGSFAGPAKALRVIGQTDTPDYEVKSAGHRVHLRAEFKAVVNCGNGDVELQSIRGQFEKTDFAVKGDVSGGSGKVASLQVNDSAGRVQDWLLLLAPDQMPPMTGSIAFEARLKVPGGSRPFIRRVRLTGDFTLTDVGFTKEKSQRDASELSLRAQGQKVRDGDQPLPKVAGKLAGHVELADGVASFSRLVFTLPGAVATAHGTYSLNDEHIDLHGQLRVDNKFSKTSSGPKRLFTRATEALFAKSRGEGEVLPVKMTGTYDHPSYGLEK